MVAAGDTPAHQSRALEYPDVLGHRVERDVERLGDLGDARLAGGEPPQDAAAGVIGKGDQGVVELHRRPIFTQKDEYVKTLRYRHGACERALMPESRYPPLPAGEPPPPLQDKDILVAVEDCRRLERILAGHRLTIPHSVEEAKHELERREFAMVILGVLFDESRMFELLRIVRTFDANRFTPI